MPRIAHFPKLVQASASILLIGWLAQPAAAQIRSGNPQPFEQMMRQFAKHAEPFAPGVLGEVPAEQLAKLDKVKLSLAEERDFGKRVLQNYEAQLQLKGKSISWRGRDVNYLAALAATLHPSMRHASRYRQLQVGVLDLDTPDAYSIPGGYLLFTTELLQTAGSEAALVGVIGHELSHLDRGHQLYTLKQSKLARQSPDMRNMMSAVAAFAKPFHAEFESQADQDAFEWMVAAGYDPRELAHLLDRWDQQQAQRQPWLDAMPSFVRTHPDAGARAAELLRAFDRLPPRPQGWLIGRENLESRSPHPQRIVAK